MAVKRVDILYSRIEKKKRKKERHTFPVLHWTREKPFSRLFAIPLFSVLFEPKTWVQVQRSDTGLTFTTILIFEKWFIGKNFWCLWGQIAAKRMTKRENCVFRILIQTKNELFSPFRRQKYNWFLSKFNIFVDLLCEKKIAQK